jgi:hypothetical protein
MSAALEYAGAERGVLLLPQGHELRVEAEAVAEGSTTTVRLGVAAVRPELLPDSILRHLVRTHEIVMLGDASAEAEFASDPSIQRNRRGRSCACP